MRCPRCGSVYESPVVPVFSCENCGNPYLNPVIGADQPYKASPGWLDRVRKLAGR